LIANGRPACRPAAIFHNRTASSFPAEANVRPSGLNANPNAPTPRGALACCRLVTSHNRMVLSSLAEATVRPSGLNTTVVNPSVCPVNIHPGMAGAATQRPRRGAGKGPGSGQRTADGEQGPAGKPQGDRFR
jgi:hypothetical protein